MYYVNSSLGKTVDNFLPLSTHLLQVVALLQLTTSLSPEIEGGEELGS